MTPSETEPRPRVLVVDDDPAVLRVVERTLAPAAVLVTALDPAVARSHVARQPFDVVVSDFAMPGEDGISFLTHVSTVLPQCVRILFTAAAPPHAQNAVDSGAIHHVVAKARGALALVPLCKPVT